MGKLRVFSYNGWVVHHPNPETDPDFENRGAMSYDAAEFAGRRPILVDNAKRHVYVGEPNWYHHDTEIHHNLGYDAMSMHKGYFGATGPDWGQGNLAWYGGPHENHQDIANSLIEAGFDIPNPDQYALDDGLEESPDIDWDDD